MGAEIENEDFRMHGGSFIQGHYKTGALGAGLYCRYRLL
ncbi:hypothetical protein GJA_2771 [Janthinobacterium agaricidamnosum NBRC 102515 = DSM 9628]|uniref:Uncharacterized protein n=1 Tax=Janthinobacterium agaricidamnosum NBRC 102515 = DSM 9628 TaxID=1349767 RepID=W0V6A1_9BURK|nr:hypothetical protein GJA_2771 [Janthinobacterium agaricidamnosum NBRC 102515 = DSM 9628]